MKENVTEETQEKEKVRRERERGNNVRAGRENVRDGNK